MRLTAQQIADYTLGSFVVEPKDAAALITDITWDSRKVKAGDVYVALPGERVDGNDFVGKALQAGASCALVTKDMDQAVCQLAEEKGASLIKVADTAQAITDLAAAWRTFLKGKIIALTGSTGKTTTKNLVRDVLSDQFSVVATLANQNNELGVPRTLLAANPETEVVIVEMGMRGLGQIESLCSFVRPDWGIITNVGDSHVELLGSRDNIARAKAELFCALPEGEGWAFMNAGNDYCNFVREEAKLSARGVTCVLYDGTPAAQAVGYDVPQTCPAVWAEDVRLDEEGRPGFILHVRGVSDAAQADTSIPCQLELRGMHNAQNACAAAAVAHALGMTLPQIAAALAKAQPESGRQEFLKAPKGFTVINDAYNASPDSMGAALNTLCALKISGRRVAVLGDMGELGDSAPEYHEGVGRVVASLPVDYLICIGPLSENIAQGAVSAGMDEGRIDQVYSIEQCLGLLVPYMKEGDAVLVKASHAMELEHVVEGLVK